MAREKLESEVKWPTQEEQQERIDRCVELIRQGQCGSQIEQTVAEQFGIDTRSVRLYLRTAQAQILREFQRPIDELRAESLAFYQQVLRDGNYDLKTRLRAAKRIARLTGRELPSALETGGLDGRPIE